MDIALANALDSYAQYMDSVETAIWNEYVSACLDSSSEIFDMDKLFSQYHYTLYYYDQAGNLIKTVPPQGVAPITNETLLAQVQTYRFSGTGSPFYPSHTLETRYHYNTLNQLIQQYSPDAGTTKFWYDRLGRIVASQNEKQEPFDQYSYTKYDNLGRIIEAGRMDNDTVMTYSRALDNTDLANWHTYGTNKAEVVRTYYDEIQLTLTDPFGADGQQNLRNRIGHVTFEFQDDNDHDTYDFASHYSYDIAGNVKILVQEYASLHSIGKGFKRIDYDYDLISGNVNYVHYQKDSVDYFGHWYVYDADNKLIQVYTDANGNAGDDWDLDANYLYYKHGPLARIELGSKQVQGLDYAYTIQGWLKGMNADQINKNIDMGLDSKTGGAHADIGRDVAGFSLNYFTEDYRPIGTTNFLSKSSTAGGFGAASGDLFNGNIKSAVYALELLDDETLGYSYSYDQLNRLTGTQVWDNFSKATNIWPSTGSALSTWKMSATYDSNGNILSLNRNGSSPVGMDSLSYAYYPGTNRLKRVDDIVSSSNYAIDVDDQSGNNYKYDAIGNLVQDASEEIDTIIWTLSGKVDSISRSSSSTKDELKFLYDPFGNRIAKIVTPSTGGPITYWYVRDAQGNILSVYAQTNDTTIGRIESHIYGSSRLGMYRYDKSQFASEEIVIGGSDTTRIAFEVGLKRYEITNHLGNVLAVISDKKNYTVGGEARAEIIQIQDYYPYGMMMPDRDWSSESGYRFGFNGKEIVDNSHHLVDYGFRLYNPGIARFLTYDPYFSKYPFNSPYAYCENRPIDGIDLDGLEFKRYVVLLHGYDGSDEVINTWEVVDNKVENGFTKVVVTYMLEGKFDPDGNASRYSSECTSRNGSVYIPTDEARGKMVVENRERFIAEGIYTKVSQAKDLQIIGDATSTALSISLIVLSGGSGTPIVLGIVGTGLSSSKLILDIEGRYEKSNNIPSGLGEAVGITIDQLYGLIDKNYSGDKFGQGFGLAEAVITSGIWKSSADLAKGGPELLVGLFVAWAADQEISDENYSKEFESYQKVIQEYGKISDAKNDSK